MAARLDGTSRHRRAGTEPLLPERRPWRRFRHQGRRPARRWSPRSGRPAAHPILAKLTPNVTDVTEIARAAEAGGADGLSLVNTCLGMAINWRRRRPMLGNVFGGLSGPAIKPIALRIVYQVARAVETPLVGIGGIATIDDAMEYFVAGATAIQVGTANFSIPAPRSKSSTPCRPPWPSSAAAPSGKWAEMMNDECADNSCLFICRGRSPENAISPLLF